MVFSNREVIRRIKKDFVPVALKAALVNNPPSSVEGRLYGEIGRSKPAPQGICVANSAGKVLAWALSFDDQESIAAFLDYAAKRYHEFPDATKPVVAERFMRYPTYKLLDVSDTGQTIATPLQHAEDDRCPGRLAVEPGTLVGRVIGRALDQQGRPLADTLRQEHYMEARFEIPLSLQRQFLDACRKANGQTFQIPDALTRALVEPPYLGQLDVHPLGVVPGSQNDRHSWEFYGQQISGGNEGDSASIRVRITGRSDVAGGQRKDLFGSDGRLWDHTVQLDWQGSIEVKDDQLTSLTLLADGHEKLRWGNARINLTDESDARHLMAGHPIDLDCGVRYGLIGAAVAPCE